MNKIIISLSILNVILSLGGLAAIGYYLYKTNK